MNPNTDPDTSGGTNAGGARIIDNQHDFTGGPGPEIMAASTLNGDKVYNMDGEDLGEIEDIMLDVRSGRIAYAVLAFGGVMGIGEKFFAIPWSALTLDADRECLVLDIEKERLKGAPGFDKSHWPSMADQAWADEVYRYYNQRPYWTPE
jgi:sporulation protein YlmC with PRC-barrel domain